MTPAAAPATTENVAIARSVDARTFAVVETTMPQLVNEKFGKEPNTVRAEYRDGDLSRFDEPTDIERQKLFARGAARSYNVSAQEPSTYSPDYSPTPNRLTGNEFVAPREPSSLPAVSGLERQISGSVALASWFQIGNSTGTSSSPNSDSARVSERAAYDAGQAQGCELNSAAILAATKPTAIVASCNPLYNGKYA